MFPLRNRRILITRTRQQASDLALQLEALGATTILVPTIEIVPPRNYGPLDRALAYLDTFDWLLFTSANAVEAFAERMKVRDSVGLPSRVKIAVIGPATAKAVESIGLRVALLPSRYIAESLAESLATHASGCRILLIRAEDARDVLPNRLTHAGAAVTIAPAYRNQVPNASVPAIQQIFSSAKDQIDAITFTSASTARNLTALLDAAGLTLSAGIALASIGPVTSDTLRELGLNPAIEANEPTVPALVQAIAEYFKVEA